MSQKILYIDDSRENHELISLQLKNKYRLFNAHDCEEGLEMICKHNPDLILLDLLMPEVDGWDTLKYIRLITQVPVIIFTSMIKMKVITHLEANLPNYLGDGLDFVQRMENKELLLRVKKYLLESKTDQLSAPLYDDGYLSIDLARRITIISGVKKNLSRNAYLILRELMKSYPFVAESNHILRVVWPDDDILVGDQSGKLRLAIMRLRKTIEQDFQNPSYILTAPGGYRFEKKAGIELR